MSAILESRKSRLILLSIILLVVLITAVVRFNKVMDTSKLTPKEFEEKY